MLTMKGWVVISVLVCISITAHAQSCTLAGKQNDFDFPNIESISALSYEMAVEYTVPNANQTDYYVEFYDTNEKTGKVESVQNGVSSTFMYVSGTWEAWEIDDKTCVLKNITDVPRLFKDDQTNWLHNVNEEDGIKRTIGPSAMLKIAFDVWNSTERSTKMAYMGMADEPIRGLQAQYWRRCMDDNSFVHYYFSLPGEGDAYNQNKALPLRIIFGGSRLGEDPDLNDQVYDIMNFRPFIPRDLRPFDLPKGKGCRRGDLVDAPDLPSLQDKSLDFSAEVIYRKINYDGTDAQYWSYYSNLHFALDQLSGLVAYFYAPWSSKKATDGELEVDPPEFIVYDTKHHYAYKTSMETGECKIIREKSFDPYYLLPQNAGRISLTDPSILFPNSEFQFLSEGVNRGLKVNVFERVIENFEMDMSDGTPSQIPKAIVTHSYLQDNVVERNLVSVENALTQVQFKFFGRQPKVIETLTFNFFSFSTQVANKRSIFNVKRCFKNDDDYVWVTIGFNLDETQLSNIKNQVPTIQSNIVNLITLKSELSPSRIPYVLVDFTEGLYVSAMILGKPPVLLDYVEPKNDMAVVGGAEEDGNEDVEDCATKCLEEKENCWGFSICGAVCKYGTVLSAKPGPQKGCQLYNRYDNKTYIPSKEKMVEDLKERIQGGSDFKLVVVGEDDTMVQADASSIEVSEPGEDDRLFYRLGNRLNPRMRVLKTGARLNGIGKEINDMGKLRYDECQKECLDYKDCESASYCLSDQKCVITNKYGDDLQPTEIKEDNMCNLVTRKYEDHFERAPGITLSVTAEEILQETTSENCARACLKSSKFNCLSFDHCPSDNEAPCKLHTVHYPNPNTREKVQERSTSCGHYFRKFSTEFKKNPERRTAGSSLPPLTNLTIEECAKNCVEFGKGVCFGFDFCQGSTLLATSCTLLDKPMPNYKTVENKMCVNFIRAETQASPLPYSNGYAGGIGFLCFLIGGIVGALVIFGVAYFRVNRR